MPDSSPAAGERARTTPWAAAAVISCAAVYTTVFLSGRASSLLAIAGGTVWFLATFRLRQFVQQAADLPDDRLDEREIAVRDRSYLEAYRLLGGVIAASLVLAVVDDAVGDVVVSWNGAWASLLLLSAVLPSAVLAWRQQHELVVV